MKHSFVENKLVEHEIEVDLPFYFMVNNFYCIYEKTFGVIEEGIVKYLHFRCGGVFYEKEEYESLTDIHNNCFLPENNSTYEAYENALHSAMSIALNF